MIGVDTRYLKYSTCFLLLAVLVLCWAPPVSAKQAPYTIAVIPSAPPVSLHTQWAPILEQLTRETGLQFRVKLFERMADFEREIGDGTSDFIFASPIQMVVARQMHQYVPLVRGGKPVSIGLFVRKDSPVASVEDLSGKTIAFVGNKNLCSVFVMHLLANQKAPLSFSREYAGSTRNVIKNVILGKSDAGAVFIPELERELEENREQLRSVIVTQKVAPHPLSAHPRVPRELREQIKKAVLKIASTKEGAEQFKTIRMTAPVVADYERDYKPLEVMDVKRLTDWGK